MPEQNADGARLAMVAMIAAMGDHAGGYSLCRLLLTITDANLALLGADEARTEVAATCALCRACFRGRGLAE